MNISFFQALSVRLMLIWCCICLTMYPLTGSMGPKSFLQTLPFWIPVFSFWGMLYSQWDLETRLVSVAKFVENDVEWAGEHVRNSFFLRDYMAERAFHKVHKQLQ